MAISVTDPLSPAYERTAQMTFRPFKLDKWFAVGFVAWLAGLGEGGGPNFNFNNKFKFPAPPAPPVPPTPAPRTWPPTTDPSNTGPSTPATSYTAPPDPWQPVIDWMKTHVFELVLIGVAILVVIIAISLIVMWINSRGKFMLLHSIANDSPAVAAPWKQYKQLANSLLGLRVCLFLMGSVLSLAILGAGVMLALPDLRAEQFGSRAITAIAVCVPLMLLVGIPLLFINWCTTNLVTVVMYARGALVMDAWREFRLQVMPGNFGKIVLFMLMNIVLNIGLVIAQALLGCVTCCIGFLPYLGTVVSLPLILFLRCYGIYFMQQFGPQYVIIQEGPRTPPGGFPVVLLEEDSSQYPFLRPE
jgi:hypothetical protein